jgi:hypothetical protein
MSFLLKTVWESAINYLIKVAVSKYINNIKLEGLKVIGRCYSYKGLKDTGRECYDVSIFIIPLL